MAELNLYKGKGWGLIKTREDVRREEEFAKWCNENPGKVKEMINKMFNFKQSK